MLSEEVRSLSAAVTALRTKQNSTTEDTRAAARQIVQAEADTLRRRVCITVGRLTKNLNESHAELEKRIAAIASLVLPPRGGPDSPTHPNRRQRNRPAIQRALSHDVASRRTPLPKKDCRSLGCSLCETDKAGAGLRRAQSCATIPCYCYDTLPGVAHAVLILQQQQQAAFRRFSVAEAAQRRLEQMHRAAATAMAAQCHEQETRLQQQQQQIRAVQQETQQQALQMQQFKRDWHQQNKCFAESDGLRQQDIKTLVARQQQLVHGERELRQLLKQHDDRHRAQETALEQLRATQGQLEASVPQGLRDELTQLQELRAQYTAVQRQQAATAAMAARAADSQAALEGQVGELAAAAHATEERRGTEEARHREAHQALQQQMGYVRTALHRLSGEVGKLTALACDTQTSLSCTSCTNSFSNTGEQCRSKQVSTAPLVLLPGSLAFQRGTAPAGLLAGGARPKVGCNTSLRIQQIWISTAWYTRPTARQSSRLP